MKSMQNARTSVPLASISRAVGFHRATLFCGAFYQSVAHTGDVQNATHTGDVFARAYRRACTHEIGGDKDPIVDAGDARRSSACDGDEFIRPPHHDQAVIANHFFLLSLIWFAPGASR